jgi:hypothetical protein
MDSALVLTGETDPEMLAGTPTADRPRWVLNGLGELLPTSHGEDQ